MSEENITPTIASQENRETKKKNRKERAIIFLIMLAIVGVSIGIFLAGHACSVQHHSQYATGEEYSISGYVKTASKETKRSGTDRKTKHTVYKVVVETMTPLPNGSTTFESSDFEDYNSVDQFSRMPNTLVDFTISKDGYIIKAEKSSQDKGEDIDWNNPNEIANFENMTEEEKEQKLFNMW